MSRRTYAGIDYFRLPAAFMVAAIHVAPFSCYSEELDFLVTYCLGRVAVPFFFMTTGYFVLGPYVTSGFRKGQKVRRFLVKTGMMYISSVLLYLPVMLYAGNYPKDLKAVIKELVFDGFFYHLWYFPAVILGLTVLIFMWRFSERAAVIYAVLAYIMGLLGDSYYGLAAGIPFLRKCYDVIFSVSSYTRNGIFFAPVFLLLGALCARSGIRMRKCVCRRGVVISLSLMMAEGFLTYCSGFQRHNSMYLFLVPGMYFLFQLLLRIRGKAPVWIRNVSMLFYVIHPLIIVLVRGIAKASGLTGLLVKNTLIQYFFVCAGSLSAAYLLNLLWERGKGYVPESKRQSMGYNRP